MYVHALLDARMYEYVCLCVYLWTYVCIIYMLMCVCGCNNVWMYEFKYVANVKYQTSLTINAHVTLQTKTIISAIRPFNHELFNQVTRVRWMLLFIARSSCDHFIQIDSNWYLFLGSKFMRNISPDFFIVDLTILFLGIDTVFTHHICRKYCQQLCDLVVPNIHYDVTRDVVTIVIGDSSSNRAVRKSKVSLSSQCPSQTAYRWWRYTGIWL